MHEVAKRAFDIAYYEIAYRDESVLDALLSYGSATPERAEHVYRAEVRPLIARALAARRHEIVSAARVRRSIPGDE